VSELKKLPAAFFATGKGNEPVREWLKDLKAEDRRTVGQDIAPLNSAGRWGCRFAGL